MTTQPKATTAPGYLMVLPWESGEPGGVSQVVLNLGRELTGLGWNPMLLVPTWSSRAPALDSSQTLPVLRWRLRTPWGKSRPIRSLIAFLLSLPGALSTWRDLARRHNWEVVNPHFPDISTFTWVALKRFGMWNGKIVISVHGGEIRETLRGGRLERWLMARLLMTADAIVSPSAELAGDVARLAPRAKPVDVIPNGVCEETLRAERDPSFVLPNGLASGRFILNVATFEHKKSHDVLLEAFVRVAARHPDVHLVLVGRATPGVERVQGRIAATGLADRIHLFCNVPHRRIPTFLAHATVFCLPSRSEGHPLAILEAAAYGLPVVATPVGGIPETIPDEQHGILVPVDDSEALAAGLDRILADPGLAKRLGQTLQRFVETRFQWTESARQYSDLVKRLPSRARAARTPTGEKVTAGG